MAMNVSGNDGSEPEVMVEINTTPLIDVMLVLLIMLILTIPIQMHAVKLDMPNGDRRLKPSPPVVQIDIGSDGTIAWNGTGCGPRRSREAYRRGRGASGPAGDCICCRTGSSPTVMWPG